MSRTLRIALIFLPLSFASLANATSYGDSILNSWYLGVGIGTNNYERTHPVNHEFDHRVAAWDVFTGYQFNDYFGMELAYRHLGHAKWLDVSLTNNDISTKGLTLGVLVTYPFAPGWKAIFEAGAMNYLLSNNRNFGLNYYSDRDIAPYVGLGIGSMVTHNVQVSAKFRRYEGLKDNHWNTLDLDSNYWGIELSYRFGSAPKVAAKALPSIPDESVVVVDVDNDGIPDNEDQCADSPAEHQVNAIGCTLYLESEEIFTIDAKFPNDSAQLSQQAMSEIAALADIMRQNPKSIIEIKGFSSNIGDPKYNLRLSQRRANAAAHLLENQFGIASHRITARGYGIHQPLVLGNSKQAHEANRRIEANLTVIIINPAMK